ncbi:MAG: hypothetical protein ABI954_10900 [Pyrinomonadaceae bacterium]
MASYQTIEYSDELLADQSVSRVYNNNRREWRTQTADGRVEWRDSAGASGVDELLGGGIIKRTVTGGQPVYGREQGYGRTLWSNGFLTINRTSFSGRIGTALAAIGGAALIGGLVAPPLILSAQEEEQLRQQRAAQQQSGGDGGSSGGDSGSGSDWDDGSDSGDADGDFG